MQTFQLQDKGVSLSGMFTTGDVPVLLIHGFGSTANINWVGTNWVSHLASQGKRVIAFDNRGHGASQKFYHVEDYTPNVMAKDALKVLDHFGLPSAHVIGYSMGARIGAFLALEHPDRVKSLVLGGIGLGLLSNFLMPDSIQAGLEANSIDDISDPTALMFRKFAENNNQDLKALAACIKGSRKNLSKHQIQNLHIPTLVAVGTRDTIAGDGEALADMLPQGQFAPIPNREHNPAVGDKTFKSAVDLFYNSLA